MDFSQLEQNSLNDIIALQACFFSFLINMPKTYLVCLVNLPDKQ